jgi:hypothetical protein
MMSSTFSITKITGLPPEQVAVASGEHEQPSPNVVVTTGSTDDERGGKRAHLRLVRDSD